MAKEKKQKQINLEEITALTKELFHAHYAGDLERWFDYLCPDSIYLGTGEPMLFGGSAIREHFKGFEGEAADVVSEEYYPVPLGETAAQVCGRIAVRSRQNQLGAVNYFTIGWRLIGGELKLVHQHNSYEYTQPDIEGERGILKMDMNTTRFVRNLLLEQPAGRRIAFPSGNQTVYVNPICNHVTETSVVLVKADSQFNTLEDLVKFAKDNPGKLKASTNGNRASNHIGAQVLATSAGFEYTDIPYGGTADQLLALRQGEVDFSVAKVADFASFTSEVKVLAVYNQERLEGYPDVPTMGELGYYDQWLGSSRCIVAPAGTPENVIKFYEDAFQKLMEDADYLKAAEAAGMETDYKNSADTAALIKQQQDFTESLADVWGD